MALISAYKELILELKMKRMMVYGLVFSSVMGCSNQQVYNAIQENRKVECMKLPVPEYEECMRDYSRPYDEYEQERKKLKQQRY